MLECIIFDCPHADCRTPIDTGKCRKECLERYNKEMGSKPKTNADRIRSMSDEELADFITSQNRGICTDICREMYYESNLEWLKQPAE